MRRHVLLAAVPACLLLGLAPVAARADLAPPGAAAASALGLGSLLGVSSTGASANPSSADAQAAVVSLGGTPILGTGGSQAATGESGGALLDTGPTLPAIVQVAPWHASAAGSPATGSRSSKASAAAARAEVPSVLTAGVLTSQSSAEHRSDVSTGSASSDGIDLGLAGVAQLVLLHSEVGSDGHGHSSLVGLNGIEIGTSDQLGSACGLTAGDLLSLSCLTGSGGIAGGLVGGNAGVINVDTLLGSALEPVAAFSAAASSGTGSAPVATLPAIDNTDTARAVTPLASLPAGGALPRTGAAVAGLVAGALAALLSGAALRLIGRRRVAA